MVELLAVMAIILILAGMLLPSLTQSRERGRRAMCINNLHQIGLFMKIYAGDYRGSFPTCGTDNTVANCAGEGSAGGFAEFARLLANKYNAGPKLFVCPSDETDGFLAPMTVAAAGSSGSIQWFNISYFYVSKLTEQGGSGDSTKSYLLMADESNCSESDNLNCYSADGDSPVWKVTRQDNHGLAGRNALFTDGRVEWISGPSLSVYISEINTDYGGPNGSAGNYQTID